MKFINNGQTNRTSDINLAQLVIIIVENSKGRPVGGEGGGGGETLAGGRKPRAALCNCQSAYLAIAGDCRPTGVSLCYQ